MPISQQSGFPFPMMATGPQGHVSYTRNDTQKLIEASVLQILLTSPGERLWNPQFGCRIKRLLFEPDSPTFLSMAQNLIWEALSIWEKRITVRASDITVTAATDNSGQITVTIPYRINNPDFMGPTVNRITATI